MLQNILEVITIKIDARYLTRAAMIAAVYASLTLLLTPISFGFTGAVQFRVAEALTVLPLVIAEAVPGLAIGCLVANLLAGASIFDVVFGSLATLLAAMTTRALRSRPIAALAAPAVFNALIIGPVVYFCYLMGTAPLSVPMLLMSCFSVAVGEVAVVYSMGAIVYRAMGRIILRSR